MTSLKDTINNFKKLKYEDKDLENKFSKETNSIIILIDNSYSTESTFSNSKKVIEFEIEIAKKISTTALLLHKQNTYIHIFTFSSDTVDRGQVKFSSNGSLLFPPGIVPNGGTNTHIGFSTVYDFISRTKLNNVEVILITDGETNSSENNLFKEYEKLNNVIESFQIIAVSNKTLDFKNMQQNEETKIPGLDIVNWIPSKSKIYTPDYIDEPYILSTICTNTWNFLNISFSKKILFPQLISELISFIGPYEKYNPEEIQIFFIELGMYLALFYYTFPETYINSLFQDLKDLKNLKDIKEFLSYGFNLKRQNKSFIRVNLNKKIVDYQERKNLFVDASTQLKLNGTSLNSECISFNNGVICHMESSTGLIIGNKIPNIYFAFEDQNNEQAIRQGLRTMFGELYNIPNATTSSSVIFCVLNQIFLFLLVDKDLSLNDSYIVKLRKLAVIQTSMLKMIGKGHYGNSFYEYWSSGELPSQHYSSLKTHIELYKDFDINPLELPQTLWWATMMCILSESTFKAQENIYKPFFEENNIESNSESLLKYLRNKYKSQVSGTVKKISFVIKNSIITLEPFNKEDVIYVLEDHLFQGNQCSARTHYSESEKKMLGNKCVWCNYVVPESKFSKINISKESLVNNDIPRFLVEKRINETQNVQSNSRSNKFKTNNYPVNKFYIKGQSDCHLILLEGTVGSGKTTWSIECETQLKKNNYTVINESTDNYCKQGIDMKKAVYSITQSIISKHRPNKCVVIIDTCGITDSWKQVSGATITGNKIFNCMFENYKIHLVRPNFTSDVKGYLSWSLNNILSRSLHNKDTLYWLNPVSLNINLCKKIHKDKARKVLGSSYIDDYDPNDLNVINNFKKSLIDPEKQVSDFISKNI